MDRQPHDYGAPMTYGQQQQQHQATNMQQQQQQYGFHSQHQQFPPSVHGPPFLPPHPSLQQQFPYPRPMQQSQIYPHPHHHQHSPSSFPPHLPPHLVPSPFHAPYDSTPPPPTPHPSDPKLQKRIDKLVEYAVKNEHEFEAVVREREQDNPAYSFLFCGEGHNYYHHKLWIATRPYNPPFPLHPPNNPINAPNASSPYYEQQQHSHHPQPLIGHSRPGFDQPYRPPFTGVSRPLTADIEMELNGVLNSLTGTKESPFLSGLAEALRDRVFSLDDSERQLHIVYLANDILFDMRVSPQEMDNEALAFKPVLASIRKLVTYSEILQFWSSKEVFDHKTMFRFEYAMMNGLPPTPFPGPHADQSSFLGDRPAASGMYQMANYNSLQWQQHDKHNPISKMPDQEYSDKQIPPLPPQQFHPASILSMHLPLPPVPSQTGEKLPPYPLFPPGLILGMVRKMQIGSGVPYSPMSPLDIPTVIPPSNVSPSEVLERVSKFFKEIGEVNPSVGPTEKMPRGGGVRRASRESSSQTQPQTPLSEQGEVGDSQSSVASQQRILSKRILLKVDRDE
ncbi:hypothetical protein ABFS83_01G109100 [Erythranthe nasuta]